MPPFPYILTAIVLVSVVGVVLYATQMYAIFLFYWAFGATAFVLGVLGVIRVSSGAQAPLWVAFALVCPFVVWAVERLRDMFASVAVFISTSVFLNMCAALALTAAAIGCVRLVEIISAPSGLTRAAYAILALGAVVPLFNVVQYLAGATWTRNPLYLEIMSWLRWPILAAKYGAIIAAPVILVLRRNLEWWTLVPIVGIVMAEAYVAAFPSHFFMGGPFQRYVGVVFWLKPVSYFIGTAALWRLGTLLRAQRLSGAAA